MQKKSDFKNKTFLITGASSGIGKEIAQRLAKKGANLYLIGRNQERLQQIFTNCTEANPEGKYYTIRLDLEKEQEVKEAVLGMQNIDGVILSSGKIEPFPAAFINQQKIDSMLHSNFYATVIITSLLLRYKKINNNSSLVFISSVSSQFPHLGGTLYSASKAALEAYMRNIALECADKKIRANAILPGMVKTPLFDEAVENSSEEVMKQHLEKYPLGVGYPSDVAHLCAFLLSSKSRWMTGNTLVLDGGLHLGKG